VSCTSVDWAERQLRYAASQLLRMLSWGWDGMDPKPNQESMLSRVLSLSKPVLSGAERDGRTTTRGLLEAVDSDERMG
jgi:hypothetical protein